MRPAEPTPKTVDATAEFAEIWPIAKAVLIAVAIVAFIVVLGPIILTAVFFGGPAMLVLWMLKGVVRLWDQLQDSAD